MSNDVGFSSPTYQSFKFWYKDFCSSLRANAMQSSETEPSPAFVTFAHAHEQLFPLPKWRGERLEVLET